MKMKFDIFNAGILVAALAITAGCSYLDEELKSVPWASR